MFLYLYIMIIHILMSMYLSEGNRDVVISQRRLNEMQSTIELRQQEVSLYIDAVG